jgi:predicted NUDIX family phosphoesterase
MGKDDEILVGITTNRLNEIGMFQGFVPATQERRALLDLDGLRWMRRGSAESDPTFKQLISYVIVEDVNGGDIWTYTRTKQSGEGRLKLKSSIGIGGHINVDDMGGIGSDGKLLIEAQGIGEAFQKAVQREFLEEVNCTSQFTMWFRGFINDDSNDVGKVHLGLVYLVKMDGRGITPKEDKLKDEGFLSISSLRHAHDVELKLDLESWSKLCLEEMSEIRGW